MRNHLGVDFAGTNTAREGYELPPMQPGDVHTVDFHVQLPELYPSSFSFSPAIADGTLISYRMCDWIDNAVALQMGHSEGQIYAYFRMPCRVEIDARLGALADFLADIEHRRFVLLALADDDNAVHLNRRQGCP